MGRTQETGSQAEAAAETLLREHGLRPLERNYRCRLGEIDLVMRDGDTLVFVEVRYRRHADFGGALSSIDSTKQRRLLHAAEHYLQSHRWPGPCRFDVVGFGRDMQGQWVRDAFSA